MRNKSYLNEEIENTGIRFKEPATCFFRLAQDDVQLQETAALWLQKQQQYSSGITTHRAASILYMHI